jgi:hypothetical protein
MTVHRPLGGMRGIKYFETALEFFDFENIKSFCKIVASFSWILNT